MTKNLNHQLKEKKSNTFNKHKFNMKLNLNYQFENTQMPQLWFFQSDYTENVLTQNLFLCPSYFISSIMKMEIKAGSVRILVKSNIKKIICIFSTLISTKRK